MRTLVQAVQDASAMNGELKKMLLAVGVVALIVVVLWAVQEWGARKSVVALGWFGIMCMGLVGTAGAVLVGVGLL